MPMRLPPIPPADLDEAQRGYSAAAQAAIEKRGFNRIFTTRDAAGALLGPWSVWVRHPAIGRAAAMLSGAVIDLDALLPRAREIVILSVGRHFRAAYELYAHSAIARSVGLTDDQIAALCAGARPSGLSEAEVLALDCAAALVRPGPLPGFLFEALGRTFGAEGRAQFVHLAGVYAYVSVLLNGFDVATPEIVAGQ